MARLKRRPGNPNFYIQYYVGQTQYCHSTETDCYQLAKEELRQFESAQARGENPLPTRTPIAEIVAAYVEHIRSFKAAKRAQTDILLSA